MEFLNALLDATGQRPMRSTRQELDLGVRAVIVADGDRLLIVEWLSRGNQGRVLARRYSSSRIYSAQTLRSDPDVLVPESERSVAAEFDSNIAGCVGREWATEPRSVSGITHQPLIFVEVARGGQYLVAASDCHRPRCIDDFLRGLPPEVSSRIDDAFWCD